MPDIVVHNAMGDKVLALLDEEISSLIDRNIFRLSVMGPDPYLYYCFFAHCVRNDVHYRSTAMHKRKTGAFLIELIKRCSSKEMLSFTAGFICHYALDSTVHPYVNEMADQNSHMHTAVERKLDVMELERQGKQRKDLMKLFPQVSPIPEVNDAMKTVYGWEDNCYWVGYHHMKLYHWAAKDQHGILNLLFKRLPEKYASISYRTTLADNLDLGQFEEVYQEAVLLAVEMITAVYLFLSGKKTEWDLVKVIGNRSYNGGEAED